MRSIPGESDIPGVVGRRSARLAIIVPVTLRGTDTSGQAFKENTWTISVNKHGGRIASFHQLAEDDQIVVENPLLGRSANARVSRVCEKRFAEDPYEICVELVEAQNLWGVRLPPEDWQKEGEAEPEEEGRTSPQAALQSPEPSAATAGMGERVDDSGLTPRESTAEAGENTGGLSQFNLAVNALSRLAGEAGAPLGHTEPPRQEATGIPKSPTTDLLGLKSLQEKIDEAKSLRQEMSALADRVHSARAEIEDLLLKAREARHDGSAEAEQVAKRIEEASEEKLQDVLTRLDREIEQKLGSGAARWAGETEQRLQAGAAGIVESVSKELSDRLPPLAQKSLSKAVVEFQAECKRAAKEVRAELDASVKEASAAAEAGIRKATEGVSPAMTARMERAAEEAGRQQVEAFQARIEQTGGEKLQAVLSRLDQEIEQRLGSASARWTGETEQRLQAGAASIVESVIKELSDRLAPLAQENVSKAVAEFHAECKSAAEKARAGLDASVKAASAAAEAGIREVTERVFPAMTAPMEGAADEAGRQQLEAFQARIEQTGGEKLQAVLSRLDQEIEQKLGSAAARWAGETEQRLQAGAVGIVESVTKELSDRLAPLAQENLSKAVAEFHAECKSASEKARAEMDGLVKEATAAAEAGIRRVTEGVSPAMTAQMERAAEEAGRRQFEAFKTQIESAWKSSEESIRHSLEVMRREIQAEALNAGIQARKICKEESVTAAKAISVCVDSAVDSLNRSGDEAAAKLQGARQTLELDMKKAVEEYLPRLAGESASMLEKFRAEARAVGAQMQSEVASTGREVSGEAGREISEKLEGAVKGALEVVSRELSKQGAEALERLKEGLRSAQQECVEEAEKQMAAARQSTLSTLESGSGAMSASFREQLHTTLLEMLEQQTPEIETAVQGTLQGLLESLRTKIQSSADESAARVTAEIKSGAEQALQDLPDRLYKGVGMAALVAREWEEQAKTHLEAYSRQLLEIFQKHLDALTRAAQERQRSDAETLRSLFQARLNQAARLFEGSPGGSGQAEQAAREESADPPAQPLPASQDTPQSVLEPLVEKQRQVVEDLLSAFRSKLTQILAD